MRLPAFLRSFGAPEALRLFMAIFAGWLLHGMLSGGPTQEAAADPEAGSGAAEAVADPAFWTCSMDPQIRNDGPGLCPICGMDLIAAAAGDNLGPRQVRLSASAQALADIRTVTAVKQPIGREVRLTGRIAYDMERVAVVSNWMPGRLERLFVNATGVQVHGGDHLVELYNPELTTAEQELLDAQEALLALDEDTTPARRDIAKSRVTAAKQALLELGLSENEIMEVLFTGTTREKLTIYSPIKGIVTEQHVKEGEYVEVGTDLYTISDLSEVWVVLDAYETDLAWLRFGQVVSFEAAAYPGRRFAGRIASIDPVLDRRTNTARVRVNVANEELLLMPGMFVRASVTTTLSGSGMPLDTSLKGKWMCPMHPEVLADEHGYCPKCEMDLMQVEALGFVVDADDEPPLVVPASAVLITGKRAVLYVRLPQREGEEDKAPIFEGRVVQLGPRAGDAYVIVAGLEEGEEVVVSGAFRIDSELAAQRQGEHDEPGCPGAGERPHRHAGVRAPAAGHRGGRGRRPRPGARRRRLRHRPRARRWPGHGADAGRPRPARLDRRPQGQGSPRRRHARGQGRARSPGHCGRAGEVRDPLARHAPRAGRARLPHRRRAHAVGVPLPDGLR